MKDSFVHDKDKYNMDAQRSYSNEQEIIQKAVAMYDSRKYSLLEILEATGLTKNTLYPYVQNRN